ncbi:hypothetical protein DMW20_11930 [Vibrio parahaemolyticus]|nr:hypothetical protein [Vibrio parahaemolyticus]
MSTFKLLTAKQAFFACQPYAENEELSGSEIAVEMENNAFALAIEAGVAVDDDEFNHHTDIERITAMIERIDSMLTK